VIWLKISYVTYKIVCGKNPDGFSELIPLQIEVHDNKIHCNDMFFQKLAGRSLGAMEIRDQPKKISGTISGTMSGPEPSISESKLRDIEVSLTSEYYVTTTPHLDLVENSICRFASGCTFLDFLRMSYSEVRGIHLVKRMMF
jgi:hypothetical protein